MKEKINGFNVVPSVRSVPSFCKAECVQEEQEVPYYHLKDDFLLLLRALGMSIRKKRYQGTKK
jgi:hypothetical protein